jgi:hypothetical protein
VHTTTFVICTSANNTSMHKILLHLSIFYEYQQFFQHRICFSIQLPNYSDPWPTLACSTSFLLIMLFKHSLILTKINKRNNNKYMYNKNKQTEQ